MAEGLSTTLNTSSTSEGSSSSSSSALPQFVASYFVSNNTLFLHFGPDGPVLVLTKDSIILLRLNLQHAKDTVLETVLGSFVTKRQSIGDFEELWIWFRDVTFCLYSKVCGTGQRCVEERVY